LKRRMPRGSARSRSLRTQQRAYGRPVPIREVPSEHEAQAY
jgi:hypothetical protein